MYYVYTDCLGSLTALTDEQVNVVERHLFDPWGNRRNLDNDCMPTTFAEIERSRGDSRTYGQFKKLTSSQDNVGVSIRIDDYDKLVHNTFNNVETLSKSNCRKLFDVKYIQNAANNNEVFSVRFKGHVDNVRSLKVFIRAPHKNTLTF